MKALSNADGASVPASFLVDYDCGTGYMGRVPVTPTTSATVYGIPTGNVCSITEVAPDPIPGFTWGPVTYTPSTPVTIAAKGATYVLTVNNSITRDRGSLQILKALTNAEGADVPATFAVDYTCGTDDSVRVDVAPGETGVTVNGIPTGTVCSIDEVTPSTIAGYTWADVSYDPKSATITTKGETFTVKAVNSVTRDKGSLKLAKAVAGGPSTYDGLFDLDYKCVIGEVVTKSGTESVKAGPANAVTVTGIPTGSVCTVTEPTLPTPPAGYDFGTPSFTDTSGTANDGIVTIAEKVVTVTVTTNNTLVGEGSLQITKALAGGPAGYTGPFSIDYDCGASIKGTASVSAGSTYRVNGIPVGRTCVVSEPTLPSVAGYSFGTPTFSPGQSVQITSNNQVVTVTVSNTMTQLLGSLQIFKTLNDGGSGYAEPFTIDYSCTLSGSVTKAGSVSVAANGSATVTAIPTGSVCTVTEVLPADAAGFTWAVPIITGSPATITTGGTSAVMVGNQLVPAVVVPLPATVTPVEVVPMPATVIPPKAAEAGDRKPADPLPFTVAWLLLLVGTAGLVQIGRKWVVKR